MIFHFSGWIVLAIIGYLIVIGLTVWVAQIDPLDPDCVICGRDYDTVPCPEHSKTHWIRATIAFVAMALAFNGVTYFFSGGSIASYNLTTARLTQSMGLTPNHATQ